MKPVRDEGVGCVSREMRVVKGSMHCWPEETSGLSVFFFQLCLMFLLLLQLCTEGCRVSLVAKTLLCSWVKVFGLCFVQACPRSLGHCDFESRVVLPSPLQCLGGF